MRKVQGAWAAPNALLWTPTRSVTEEGKCMAEEESILVNPPTQDVAVHVRDYERFTRLFKYGAIVCLIIGFIVLLILK
jgi:hypothetical protein